MSKPLQNPLPPVSTSGETPARSEHERIRQRAYELYVERGYRDGRAEEYRFEAEFEIRNGAKSA